VPKPLSRSEVQELAESVRLLLVRVRDGELSASTATTYRLEGALIALRGTLGERSGDLVEELLRKHT
jgi:hypothetical protein